MRARLVAVAALVAALWAASLGIYGPDGGKGLCAAAPGNSGRVFPDFGPASEQELDRERAALVALYEATDGENWRYQDGWLTNRPIGEWAGVVTDHYGRVIVLEKRLGVGELPPELADLTNLRTLVLGGPLVGTIPPYLASLERLLVLDLSGSGLTGSIPPQLGELHELRVLDLRGNSLSGEIPEELGRLAQLRELYLGANQLEGRIPPELGRLANVRLLSLENNALAGPIPPALQCLTELRALYVSENELSGSAPDWLWTLTELEDLFLGTNQFTGPIPASLGQLPQLHFLDLCDNQLVGPVPVWISEVQRRGAVCLSGNDLAGAIPCGKQMQSSFNWDFVVYEFCPEGETPQQYSIQAAETVIESALASVLVRERTALTSLYYAMGGPGWNDNSNWLTDRPLNSWHGVATDAQGHVIGLSLPENGLRGTIPSEVGDLRNLVWISLPNNALSGPIPRELGNLWELTYLRLEENELSGPVPPELGNLTRLEWLSICGNQLSGSLPAELASHWRLGSAFVFEGNDELSGPLPNAVLTVYIGDATSPCGEEPWPFRQRS